jgi:hypothetical protein
MRRPLVRDQRVALALGVAAFGAGWVFLWDAYDARGKPMPRPLRLFTWW